MRLSSAGPNGLVRLPAFPDTCGWVPFDSCSFQGKGAKNHPIPLLARAAVRALVRADHAGAQLAGMGFIIEKAFQQGGGILRDRGIHIESLAMIDSLDNCRIHIRD